MRAILSAAALAAVALGVGSCATMSEEQCLAGDWAGQGFSDGAAGYAMSRLGEHAEACVKHGVVPDDAAYRAGWSDGVLRYCTIENGFRVGAQGGGYAGVCPADVERDFLIAYEDGRVIHLAEQAVSEARSRIDSNAYRLEELDDKLDAKQRELRAERLTDAERDVIRNRIRELRREREDTEREWRRAQRELDDAEARARDVRWRMESRYR
ncbi:DUF2799 domain-containing protein [Brevundimonas viscosa]|uniref:DUF2799 domain-containing protein n=1 Tax=Brevundimonas viscosa TaxID=871741 RepID=A0A1I6SHX2_9CAUL|nr:DUF2799 domain-containing protein [Brevundimonas viscosa]SFS76537.1 Protein of unknown function [Brevundimonas viscosa]